MWNRIEGPKGFDTDAVLPFRERLIVWYFRIGEAYGTYGIGEAYVDNGIWYWWDSNNTNCKAKIQENYQLILWTLSPPTNGSLK
jgi:hypothetical protein